MPAKNEMAVLHRPPDPTTLNIMMMESWERFALESYSNFVSAGPGLLLLDSSGMIGDWAAELDMAKVDSSYIERARVWRLFGMRAAAMVRTYSPAKTVLFWARFADGTSSGMFITTPKGKLTPRLLYQERFGLAGH